MADNRKIVNAVRAPVKDGVAKVYGPGEEDELEEALDKATIDRLIAAGSLEGDWGTRASKASMKDSEEATRLAAEKEIEAANKKAAKTESFDIQAVERMNRDQLIEYAKAHDVKTTDSMTKPEIIKALKEKYGIETT